MINRPVLRSENKNNDQGVEQVCQGSVESPEGFRSTAAASAGVKGKVGRGDLGGELGEGFLEKGWRGVVSLY